MSYEEGNKSTWELVKENAAPLQRGRNASTLGKHLAFSSKLSINKVKEEDLDIRTYESLVENSERFGKECLNVLQDRGEEHLNQDTIIELSQKYGLHDGDILSSWLRYIKYHEEAYPSDTHTQFLLMERCTRAFLYLPRYADDPRYIRVCVLYADRTSNPNETFISFHHNKIGLKTSIFWLAWAWLAEKKEDFAFAEKIFRKAISKKAQPINIVEVRYKQFQRRMSRHFLNSADRIQNGYNDEIGEDDNNDVDNRRVLGSISEEGVKYNQRSSTSTTTRPVQSQQSLSSTQNIGRGNQIPKNLTVYVDYNQNDSPGRSNLDNPHLGSGLGLITTEQDKCKENKISAERWNERGGLKAPYNAHEDTSTHPMQAQTISQRWTDSISDSRSSGTGPFAVFVDEEFVNQNSYYDTHSLRQQANPSKVLDIGKSIRNDLERVSYRSDTDIFQKSNKIERSTDEIYAPEELCFEEKRAKMNRYTLSSAESNFNNLMIKCPDDSFMEIDDTTGEFSDAQIYEISKIRITENNSFASNSSFQTHSTCNSSVVGPDAVGIARDKEETINTRLAARELSMMFSSPVVGDKSVSNKTPNSILPKSSFTNYFSSSVPSRHRDRKPHAVTHLPSITSMHEDSIMKSKKTKLDSNVTGEDAMYTENMCRSSILDADSNNDNSNFKIFEDDRADNSTDGNTADLLDIERVIISIKGNDEKSRCRNKGNKFMKKPERMDEFGDISLIAPTDDTYEVGVSLGRKVLPYDEIHRANTHEALSHIHNECMTKKDTREESGRCTYYYPSIIPQSLTKSVIRSGCHIELGHVSCIYKHELGRGCNGTVILVSFVGMANAGHQDAVALKIQRPTSCLAWEYIILRTINGRLCKSRKEKNIPLLTPFPRPISFSLFSDGGILCMTAASGINLLDVVNAHKGTVPELVTIYYTARMLSHLETLHLECGILHCDVKPDNWVLITAAPLFCETPISDILGGDIMLVDFGRSIDILSCNHSTMPTFFTGSISAEDMECIAMRESSPWAADVDTFGLCASVHALLFGCHMEVEFDSENSRWQLKKRFRRYWRQHLWSKIFDTLLNLTPGEFHSIKLGELKKDFESFLGEVNVRSEVVKLLKGQYGYFPRKF